jgi:hypothetical protein
MSLKHPSHVLDDLTGNCTACGASHEYMLDFQNVPCRPDGLAHPREPVQFDWPGPELRKVLADGYQRTELAMALNMRESMFGSVSVAPKPTPWYAQVILRLRFRVAQRLTDFASWIAGFDVRGD